MSTAVPITAIPSAAAPAADPAAGLFKRIVILAAASFTIGFVGFIAFDGVAMRAQALEAPVAAIQPADAQAAPAALPASDDWNLPKQI